MLSRYSPIKKKRKKHLNLSKYSCIFISCACNFSHRMCARTAIRFEHTESQNFTVDGLLSSSKPIFLPDRPTSQADSLLNGSIVASPCAAMFFIAFSPLVRISINLRYSRRSLYDAKLVSIL